MIVCFYNYQMTEVQLLCASERELVTHRKPSLSCNISSFTLAVLLLNLLQTQSGNEAVAIHFCFSSSPPAEETAYIFFETQVLQHKQMLCKCCYSFECHFSCVISSKTQNVKCSQHIFHKRVFYFLFGQWNLPFTCRLQTQCEISSLLND